MNYMTAKRKSFTLNCAIVEPAIQSYRPSNTVRLMLFIELLVFSSVSFASEFLCAKYTGCFGVESVVVSFSNIKTTDDMSGLLFGLSCTHKSPIWIHRRTSVGEHLSTMDESTISIGLPSFHKFHA